MHLFALVALAASATSAVLPQRQAHCDMAHPAGLPRTLSVSATPSGPFANQTSARLAFSVPEGVAGPCSLVSRFPAGYAGLAATGSNSTRVDVVALDGPAAGGVVGTATLAADGAAHTVNSFPCRRQMAFRLQMAGNASVSFTATEAAGLSLTYNC